MINNLQRWVFVGLLLAILVVFSLLGYTFFSSQQPANALPTLVAFNTLSPSETAAQPSPAVTGSLSLESLPSETALTETSPTETATTTPSATESLVLASSPSPTATNTVVSSSTTGNTNNNSGSTATTSGAIVPMITLAASATATTASPTNTPQAGVTAAPATATLDSTGLIPFNQGTNIGVGELRVLSMTAPADEVILSLGGSIPPIQSNQQWVLVELFLICPSETNCAPASSNFNLISTSSSSYTPTSLAIESAFGSLILGNQVLGHLAYVIPRSESPFALQLSLNGQTYRFALQ